MLLTILLHIKTDYLFIWSGWGLPEVSWDLHEIHMLGLKIQVVDHVDADRFFWFWYWLGGSGGGGNKGGVCEHCLFKTSWILAPKRGQVSNVIFH